MNEMEAIICYRGVGCIGYKFGDEDTIFEISFNIRNTQLERLAADRLIEYRDKYCPEAHLKIHTDCQSVCNDSVYENVTFIKIKAHKTKMECLVVDAMHGTTVESVFRAVDIGTRSFLRKYVKQHHAPY